MPDSITKLIFRRGQFNTGKTIILTESEPGYTTDTKRLYVGDGVSNLGVPAGPRNFGLKNFSAINFAQTFSGSEVGDFVYDDFSNRLYFLTAYPGTTINSWARIDFVVEVDDFTIGINAASAIYIKDNGVKPVNIDTSVVGLGLQGGAGSPIGVSVDNNYVIVDTGNQMTLNPGNIDISVLGTIAPLSILGNTNNFNAPISEIQIDNLQVLGRFAGALGGINFSDIVQNGGGINNITGQNGLTGAIVTSSIPFQAFVGLDPTVISVSPSQITLQRETVIDGNLIVTGLARVSGDIIAFYSSDENLKSNIRIIENSAEKLSKIKGVRFNWKENGDNDIGVIAQDVESVIPEAVVTRVSGIKAVNYDKIIPLLVNTVNELTQKVKQLEERIEKLS